MAIPGADRFLNCVLNRSKKDIILKILVLLLVVLGTPAYMLNGIVSYQLDTEFDLSQYFNVVLFMCVVAAYVMYNIVKSLVRHKERDVEWMSALIEYATYFGGDTQKLSEIRDDLSGLVTRNYQRGAFVLFVAITVAVVVQAVLDMLWLIQFEQLGIFEVFDMVFIFVILSTICLIVHDRISMIDVLQYRFTLVFSKMMNDDVHHLDPMPKVVWRSKPLRHMILMCATLGFYSIPYALWTVHQMNLHIKRQWTYERKALEWMAARDGAVAVDKEETVSRKGVFHNLKRVI